MHGRVLLAREAKTRLSSVCSAVSPSIGVMRCAEPASAVEAKPHDGCFLSDLLPQPLVYPCAKHAQCFYSRESRKSCIKREQFLCVVSGATRWNDV